MIDVRIAELPVVRTRSRAAKPPRPDRHSLPVRHRPFSPAASHPASGQRPRKSRVNAGVRSLRYSGTIRVRGRYPLPRTGDSIVMSDPQNYLGRHQGRRRRWWRSQRRQPHDRCGPEGRRVHRGQHRRPGVADERRRREARHRSRAHPRPRCRLRSRGGPPGRRGARRRDPQTPSTGPTWCSSPPARAAAPGTGAAPVIAEVAKSAGRAHHRCGHPPVRVRGTPTRSVQAEQGIQKLKEKVDTLIVIPNDRLLSVATNDTSVLNAFKMADEILLQGVQGITDLITTPGLINTDFADVRTVMSDAGSALMGIGSRQRRGPSASRRRAPIISSPCWRRRSRTPAASCSTSPVAPTSGSSRSTRRPKSSMASPTRTRTSSSVR